MSSLLYRWALGAHRKPWYVIAAWALVVAVIGVLIAVDPPRLSSDIRIDGTPAQEVLDDLAEQLPEAAGGQGIIAFRATDGQPVDEGENLSALLATVENVYGADHVVDARQVLAAEAAQGENNPLMRAAAAVGQAGAAPASLTVDDQAVPGVVVSPDRTTALFQFAFDEQTFELPEGTVGEIVDLAEKSSASAGLEVLPSSTMLEVPEIIGTGELVGVLVAAGVLVVTLGSVVAAGLPLLSALSGIAVGVGGTLALAELFPMHSLTVVLGLMLGLAVGIDYALFIVNRQRRLILDEGLSSREATGRAVGTAGSAVLFAGATVVIALLALLVVQIQLLTTMALAAAATVLLAVLAALTLLPAFLGVLGERVCSPKARAQVGKSSGHRVARRWSGLLVRFRIPVLVVGLAVAGVLTVPALDTQLGLPSGSSYGPETTQRRSYEAVADSFGPGYNGPLVVVATGEKTIGTDDVAGLYQDLSALDGVEAVSLGGMSADGATAVFSLVPATAPTDEATADLVTRIRDASTSIGPDRGVEVGVTGFSALAIDVSDRMADVLPLYIAVVVGLSLIVLLLVFRSVVVPLKATIGFLLSVGATFGATTAVFQWGWLQPLLGLDATTPVLSLLPVLVTGVLYGLAMDYEVFLVSSVKEAHVQGHSGDEAVTRGFMMASRVVVAAAVIMISVFAGFVLNPEPMIAQVGFALAFGVLVDAFLVRLTLVPAVMALVGDRAWWLPAGLDRLLPDLDIEGDRLRRRLADQDPEVPVTVP